MEYDVDSLLRVSLDKFLKGTIEIQPLEQELLHSLKNIERLKDSENSESTNRFESFDIVH